MVCEGRDDEALAGKKYLICNKREKESERETHTETDRQTDKPTEIDREDRTREINRRTKGEIVQRDK